MSKTFARFLKNESGATAIEYALIAGIVGVGLIAVLQTLGGSISTGLGAVGTAIEGAPAAGGTGG